MLLQGLHGVVDDLIMHGAAEERVGMTDQGRVGGVGLAFIEQCFEAAGGAAEIFDVAQHDLVILRHPS